MEQIIYLALATIISFSFTAFSVPQIVKVTQAKGLFDTPNSRKLNKTVIPTLGGVALFIGIMMGITIGGNGLPFYDLKFIFGSIMVTFFAGMKDDLVGISPKSKLMALSLSILIIMFFADIRFDNFYGFLGIYQIGYLPSLLITFFVGIVIINAFNLIDGIDGLASLLSIEISTVFGIWFAFAGITEYALMAFALTGSCLGFFFYNVYGNKHKIFMGDTGSLLIGTIIFVLAAKFSATNNTLSGAYVIHSVPAVLIGFLAYPLFDVLRVFFLRVVICRRSPFSPDKNHIHHRLLAIGFNHGQATFSIVFTNGLFIILSLLLQSLNVAWLTLILFSIALILSFCLEFYILNKNKIKLDDEYQTLLLPSKYVQAKLKSNESI